MQVNLVLRTSVYSFFPAAVCFCLLLFYFKRKKKIFFGLDLWSFFVCLFTFNSFNEYSLEHFLCTYLTLVPGWVILSSSPSRGQGSCREGRSETRKTALVLVPGGMGGVPIAWRALEKAAPNPGYRNGISASGYLTVWHLELGDP